MNYRDAILKVIAHEGGAKITNLKSDLGGLTKFGISQRSYPNLDIKNLTQDEAIKIYKRDYWDKIGGDKIKFYSVAFAIFDQAVNRGVATALKQAQAVAGVKSDGRLGPATINAINAIPEREFLDRYILNSIDAYQKIVSNNPGQEVFLKGWLNRVDSLKKYSLSYLGTENAPAIIGVSAVLVVGLFFLIFLTTSKKTKLA